MLSKESYELLKNFPEKVCIKDQQPIHQELKKAGYLDIDPTGAGDIQNYRYYVTDAGRAAVEEYDRMLRAEKLSEEANAISRKANRKSTAAIIVAIIAILAQIASGFRPKLLALLQRLSRG